MPIRISHLIPGVLLGLGHIVAWKTGVYDFIPHLDSIMHLLGGIFVALGIYGIRIHTTVYHHPLTVLGGTTIVAVAWEYFEYGLNVALAINWQNSIGDTLKDIFLAQVGAILVVMAYCLWTRLRIASSSTDSA